METSDDMSKEEQLNTVSDGSKVTTNSITQNIVDSSQQSVLNADSSNNTFQNVDIDEHLISQVENDNRDLHMLEQTAESIFESDGNNVIYSKEIIEEENTEKDMGVQHAEQFLECPYLLQKSANDDFEIQVKDPNSSCSKKKPSTSTEGCTMRHCIDPEPARSAPVDEDDFVRVPEDEPIPKGTKEKHKISLIRKALVSNPIDLAALRNLAISPGGLVNKKMRQKVWPLLLNVSIENIPPKPSQEDMMALSKTYTQVVMDVNRSSSRFPPGIDDFVRMSMKDKLVDLIMRVMLKNRKLKYYQGFHDVCITFLLCMDEDLAFAMVDRLALGNMREYLDDTMERTSLLLNYIYPLVNKCNPELCQHMERCDLGTIFALSWVITWFSHVLGDIHRILRVFDFFIASHRLMPVYLSAAFVLYREKDIYAAGDEMGYIHKCLSTIPSDLPLESLLERAGDLYLQYPPTEISNDPMLLRMNRQVYAHFNRIDSRNAARRLAQEANEVRSRLFVRATMWTVTSVVVVAAAVLYHAYRGQEWDFVDIWSPFS